MVKSKWQNLRDTYRKEYMKMIRTGNTKNGPHWKYFDKLSFLNDVLALRKKQGTIATRAKQEEENNNSDEQIENEEMEEYTDINPIRYLCEVPQVIIPDDNEDALSSVHDSNDAQTTIENQDSNNNNNVSWSVKSGSVKKTNKSPKIKFLPDYLSLIDEHSKQTSLYSEFEMHQDQDVLDSLGQTTNLDSASTAVGASGISYGDEDYHFLMSILPHLRDIPKHRKLAVRQKLQQIILDEQVEHKKSPLTAETSKKSDSMNTHTTTATPSTSSETEEMPLKISLSEVNKEKLEDDKNEMNVDTDAQ